MTAASSLRPAVRRKLVELVKAGLDAGQTVEISPIFPGAFLELDHIWVGGSNGDVEHRVFAGRALPTDDTFTLTVICQACVPGRDDTEAATVAWGFADRVMHAVHDTTLDDLQVGNGYVINASLGSISEHAERREQGVCWFVAVDVVVHTRTLYSGADAT